ncbi:hypothetical protein [Streptomyces cavernae]|uniref:hypothetical protein n=1 Tax=Streptomyces cavernae TaxID=2259034 RepID=UPI000FEC0A9E|nr:hypothetical protein [Streptomyces cavernae]
MTRLALLALFGACAAAWWVRAGLRRMARARAREAERREAYRRCMTEEEQRQAAKDAAEVLAFEEAEMARLVAWYRMTEGGA